MTTPRAVRTSSEHRSGFRRGLTHGKQSARDEARSDVHTRWSATPPWRRLLHALAATLPE